MGTIKLSTAHGGLHNIGRYKHDALKQRRLGWSDAGNRLVSALTLPSPDSYKVAAGY